MHDSTSPVALQVPDDIRPAVARLIRRTQQCKPATAASWTLFAQKIAEATIANPVAGPEDAAAAHWLLDAIRTSPATVHTMLADEHTLLPDGQAQLLGEGGR